MAKVISYFENLIRNKGDAMKKGTVKWFNSSKGYGFVEPSDESRDVFLHISALDAAGISNLREGQKISFDIEEHKGKISAINIRLI